ncbi:DRTGG domain-containing protein [Papillibacter cinnamivorans]|uniref:DRTGG domain-containing protein n=1 Tax=Papillibacter cinnamivorans DSM 12816 TaxID=1122930 RepID=A0A1W2A4K4_9FIRM|nr:DRTGG domain-containing protein [Papillibacter cinnamivorans]SMC55614.1 DRTGG domain-containing protein [Papillibacter cinnamivorans DSM 12816]
MKLSRVQELLKATVLCNDRLLDELEVNAACGSDLMSDVLAFVKDQGMLLTGLVNAQAIRTAEMMDMRCVVFVRGKLPGPSVVDLAAEKDIVVMSTPYSMFTACGTLYAGGLVGGTIH